MRGKSANNAPEESTGHEAASRSSEPFALAAPTKRGAMGFLKDNAMKVYFACTLATVACVGALIWAGAPSASIAQDSDSNMEAVAVGKAEPFAVVELFTSEGCSSCPSADAVLGKLVAEAREKKLRVFPISYHVDYWNYLGWSDPYSDPIHAKRQRDYAASFGVQRIYTPQMIVNGSTEFVGSREGMARSAVESALKRDAAAALTIRDETAADGDGKTRRVSVSVEIDGAREGDVVVATLVERGLVVKVGSGENGGRTLSHENVARALAMRTVEGAEEGKATIRFALDAPADAKLENASVIAYARRGPKREIVGAACLDAKPTADDAPRR
jgi:hypothetical protein